MVDIKGDVKPFVVVINALTFFTNKAYLFPFGVSGFNPMAGTKIKIPIPETAGKDEGEKPDK